MFEGKKVRLRAYKREDLLKAREYLNNPETAAMMRPGILFPLRQEDEDKWYEGLDPGSNREYNFAIEDKNDGTYLGGCGVHNLDAKNRHGSIGVFLGEEHTGKGYGTDALRVLICLCFEEINLNKVKLNVYSFNQRARACYEKLGFRSEGVLRQEIYRHGKYHDNIVMGLLRSEWAAT